MKTIPQAYQDMQVIAMARIKDVAQFITVCRSVKTACTCENLPPVAEPVSRHQEILSHGGALPCAPTLQRCTVPSLHPYAPVERPSAAMSSMPEPPHWTLGHVPIPYTGIGGFLSIPAELASPECLRAGRTDLTSGFRPSDCT